MIKLFDRRKKSKAQIQRRIIKYEPNIRVNSKVKQEHNQICIKSAYRNREIETKGDEYSEIMNETKQRSRNSMVK